MRATPWSWRHERIRPQWQEVPAADVEQLPGDPPRSGGSGPTWPSSTSWRCLCLRLYVLKEWVRSAHHRFERNPRYYLRGQLALDAVDIIH